MRVEWATAAATSALEFLLPRACVACARPMPSGDHRLACGHCWQRVRAGVRTRLRGAHLVLVDDVVTTGATLAACAAALFASGARIISLVTFGRAPAIGDAVSPPVEISAR